MEGRRGGGGEEGKEKRKKKEKKRHETPQQQGTQCMGWKAGWMAQGVSSARGNTWLVTSPQRCFSGLSSGASSLQYFYQWRGCRICRGLWIDRGNGQSSVAWHITRPNAGSCTWEGAKPATSTAWERSGGRAALQEGLWGCWLTGGSAAVSSVPWQPRGQTPPGVHQAQHHRPVQRVIIPLRLVLGRPHLEHCVQGPPI